MYKLKTEGGKIVMKGKTLTQQDLTDEVVKALIDENQNYAELFIFEEDKPKAAKKAE